MFTISKIL